MASLSFRTDRGPARGPGFVSPLPRRVSGGAVSVTDVFVSSAEELEDAAGGDVHYCQLAAGRFRGRLTRLRTARLEVCLESWSVAMLRRGGVPRRCVDILVSLGRGSSHRLQGQPAAAGKIVVLFEGEAFDYRSAEPAQLATFRFERDFLEARVRARTGRGLAELRLEGRLEGRRLDPARLRNLYQDAIARARTRPPRPRGNAIAEDLEAFVLGGLVGENAASGKGVASQDSPGRSWVLALRAEAWLRECLAEPPTIADLCAALRVGERTIHEAFREHLGTTPMAYLKTLRLNAARHDLRRAAADARVTDVALDWGFLHFGWFSQDYRRLFGETPSQTLQRAREEAARASRDGARATA